MKKKLLKLLVGSMVLSSAFAIAACNQEEPTPTPDGDEIEETIVGLELSKTVLRLGLNEQFKIEVNKNLSNETVVWTSSNSAVATVTDGMVRTLTEGTATITAKSGIYTATCEVTVTNNNIVPVLNIQQTTYNVNKGTEFVIDADVTYNQLPPIDPVNLTWNLVDSAQSNYVTITPSQDTTSLTVQAIGYGSATIQVYGELYGTILAATIEVNVVNTDLVLDVENMTPSQDGYDLDLVLLNDDQNVSSFAPIVTVIYKDVVQTDAEIVWTSENPDVAFVDENGIHALSVGQTVVKANYNNEKEVVFNVNVAFPNVDYVAANPMYAMNNVDIDMRTAGDDVTLQLHADVNGTECVFARVGQRDVDIAYSGNTLTIALDSLKLGESDLVLIFKGEKQYYSVNQPITKATAVLKTKADVNQLSVLSKAASSDSKKYDGYFVLGNDIDFDGAIVEPIAPVNSCNDSEVGFVGTIDGRGYTIDRMQSAYYGWGFIGGTTTGATLKNIAFTNSINPGYGPFIALRSNYIAIENVYVHFSSVKDPGLDDCTSLLTGMTYTASIKNVVIDVTDVSAEQQAKFGANMMAFSYSAPEASLQNCYLIGNNTIKMIWNKSNFTTGRYATAEEMAAASLDYSSFDKSFWKFINGVPYPKTYTPNAMIAYLTQITEKSQIRTAHGVAGNHNNQTDRVALDKGAIANVSRLYFGCGCHDKTIHYKALNYTKDELIAMKENGMSYIKVAFGVDTDTGEKVTFTANFGSRVSVTTNGDAWNYSYTLKISLDEVIENYDTISAEYYAFFVVTGFTEGMISVSDILIC